jgi:hypothetical protein
MLPILKLALSLAKLPIVAVLILEVLWYGLEKIPALAFLAGDYLYFVKIAIFLWAGYKTAKLLGFNIKAALLAGAFTGLAAEIIDLILSAIFYPGYYGFGYWFGDFIKWIIIAAAVAGAGHFFFAKYSGGKQNSPEPQKPEAPKNVPVDSISKGVSS